MGNVEGVLPHRVNLVCGGRWALAKSGWQDCPASVKPAHQVLTSDSRKNSQFMWFVKWLQEDEGEQPSRCVIRNDYHPQRSLRAGDPVMLDEVEWTNDHVWDLEYFNRMPRNAQAVGAPFRLVNAQHGVKRYLTVCEEGTDAKVVMQQDPPDLLWQFFDAAGRTAQLSMDLTTCCISAMPRASTQGWKSDVNQAGDSGTPELPAVDLPAVLFSGSLDDAVATVTKAQDGVQQYTPPSESLRIGTALADPMEVAQPPATAHGVMEVLLGQTSSFRERLADGEQPTISPLRRHPKSAHVGVATASLLATIPVLGKRIFSEEMRVALCQEGSTTTLLIQTVEKLAIGFPVGNMFTERLHLFSQDNDGPIRLRTVGIAQPGRCQQQALEGMAKKHVSHFIPTLQSVLQGADNDMLHRATPNGEGQVLTSPALLPPHEASEPRSERTTRKSVRFSSGEEQVSTSLASASQQEASGPKASVDTSRKSQGFPLGWMLVVVLAWLCGFIMARLL